MISNLLCSPSIFLPLVWLLGYPAISSAHKKLCSLFFHLNLHYAFSKVLSNLHIFMYVILFIIKNTVRRCQMLIFRQITLIFLCTKNKLIDWSNCMTAYAKTEQHRTKIKNGHCLQIVTSAKVQYKQNLQILEYTDLAAHFHLLSPLLKPW